MLVADFAEHLLQHVLQRHHAGDGPEFVHHHRQMGVVVAEFVHQLVQRLGLGHHQHLAQVAPQTERNRGLAAIGGVLPFAPDAHQILVVDESDDVLGLALVNRNARILVFERDAQKLVQGRVGGHRDDVDSRRHDLARVDFPQPEQLLDRVLLECFQMPFAAAGLQDEFELLGRMPSASVCPRRPMARDRPAEVRSTTNTKGAEMR